MAGVVRFQGSAVLPVAFLVPRHAVTKREPKRAVSYAKL
jgi:hypothetical protein